jgi:crotonobetainyl-CoA:carnitine CoA-transferase CaiB-like acyl-CoA transferase
MDTLNNCDDKTATEPAVGGPLSGITVIDITEVVMGPSATQMLGDLGAEVIKIEPPEGDVLRGIGPNGSVGMGPLFLNLNRNKKSVVLNLKSAGAKEIVFALVKKADVLVYNVRPQAMKRLGLGYETLKKINPKLIYVGTFGFSQRGRYAAERAFDDLIQAAVAIPDAVMRNGAEAPKYVPVTIADRAVGLYAFGVICAALVARSRTGEGQSVDVPMFETMAQFVLGDHLYGHTFIPPQGDFGYPRILTPHRRPYETKDGYICCVVYSDAQWRQFLELVGQPDLFDNDPRFKDIGARTKNISHLYAMLGEELKKKTTAEWRSMLGELGIPVFPMHTFETLMSDEHLDDINFFQEIDHPSQGRLKTMACPSEWTLTKPVDISPPPELGQHTDEVLGALGFSADELCDLEKSGAIVRHASNRSQV